MTDIRTYRIGEVAAATGVTVEALRFYEREGLLSPPLRSAHGARRYGAEAFERVRFVKQAQAVGLTLRDIQALVSARRHTSPRACQRIRAILAARIEDIEQQISEAQAFRNVLRDHLAACDRALAHEGGPNCPTLDAIEQSGESVSNGSRR